MASNNCLIISDTQIPFENPHALDFCKYLKRHFKISDHNVYNVGDEVDQYFGSLYKKDPDGLHTPFSEILECIEKLKEWSSAFPHSKVCISNHGMRWARKASDAEIPSIMIKKYQDVLQLPKTWQYKLEWVSDTKHKFRVIHGMGYSGQRGHINAALDSGISTAIGHLHSYGGVQHLRTGISEGYAASQKIWAMNCGSLILPEKYAFKYERENRVKPTLGSGVVINNGTTPLFFPLDL